MAEWIRNCVNLQKFVGLVKDQVDVGRAAAHPQFSRDQIAVVRATSHEEAIPEQDAVKSVLLVGSGSRMRVANCIRAIMGRLNKTQNWAVALKCLILIHTCLRDGGFMFQDQLSFYPARGGRNSLNLSKFKDTSTAFTWAVSSWIRWYAKFLEQWILTSRTLGTFLDSRIWDAATSAEKVSSLATGELVKEIVALHDLVQEACGWQAEEMVIQNFLVKDGLRLVVLDSLKIYEELKLRIREIPERKPTLQRSEASQLLQVCEKLSMESMIMVHLWEEGQNLQLLHAAERSGSLILTDYELMKTKEALRLASIQSMTASSTRHDVQSVLSLCWRRSSDYNYFGVLGLDAENCFVPDKRSRHRSMSHLHISRTLL